MSWQSKGKRRQRGRERKRKKLFECERRAWNFDSIRFFKRVNICACASYMRTAFGTSIAYFSLRPNIGTVLHVYRTKPRKYPQPSILYYQLQNPISCSSKHDHLFCAMWFFSIFFSFFLFSSPLWWNSFSCFSVPSIFGYCQICLFICVNSIVCDARERTTISVCVCVEVGSKA